MLSILLHVFHVVDTRLRQRMTDESDGESNIDQSDEKSGKENVLCSSLRFIHFTLDDLANGSPTSDKQVRLNRSVSRAQPMRDRFAQYNIASFSRPTSPIDTK